MNLVATAWAGLRARRGRALLAAAGILAAALVIGTAATVSYGLGTGFERSAERADLPDVIARFSQEPTERVDGRVRALPNLESRSYRAEFNNRRLRASRNTTRRGALQVVLGGRRGYAVVEGEDLSGAFGEAVIEQGLADEWGLRPGDALTLGRDFPLRVAGVAVSPDNVAFPLAKAARVYVSPGTFGARAGDFRANLALLWLNDPSRADITLAQARTVSFGFGELSFMTREGIRVLLDQAAGVVIALLVAFSLVALLAAGTMLAASAHSEVQRRLPSIGVQRALGFTPGRVAAVQAVEAALVALPAGALGLAIGAGVVRGPSAGLLATLNELPPGTALLGPLAGCLAAIVALVVASSTWPAWRAARRPPAEILRGGDLSPRTGRGATGPRGAGFFALGARFVLAARARWAASTATIAVCGAVVLLMLALASLLVRLRDDPGALGKRYQLTVAADRSLVGPIEAIDGVQAASERYVVRAADAYRLGEPLQLLAYPGDHTRFESPPLAEGRRLRGPAEAEVGLGLAEVLGLRPGSTLAVGLPGGTEARFRVSGIVRALENEGRMAYVRPDRLLATDPTLAPSVAIRLDPGADRARVTRALTAIGALPARVGGASTDNRAFLTVLASVLRGVGLAVGLVCLYALVQSLAVTARERRGSVALLRATGGDRWSIAALLAGAAAVVAVPAAVIAVALEAFVLGPLVADLAAGYASLPLSPGPGQVLVVAGGLGLLAAVAAGLVARRVLREPIVLGLREE